MTDDQFARFVAKYRYTDGPRGCWEWTGSLNNKGYGVVRIAQQLILAHRAMYAHVHGPIPAGMFACHKCDNRRCVNPTHVFLGTAQDNTDDMIAKGRGKAFQLDKVPRGERAGMAKITEAQACLIISLDDCVGSVYARAKRIAATLALPFTLVRAIVERRTWKHLVRPNCAGKGTLSVER